MNKLILNSHAKLNLYLEILGKRKDAYHNIKTLFERIDLADTIILKPRHDGKIKIISNSPFVPLDNSNLCYRSAELLKKDFDVKEGMDIQIIKRIPVGAGLGGGSSNAASVLLGLNKIWRLELGRKKLIGYAQKIGADVAFFLYNCSFARGGGRGDEIKPLRIQRVRKLWHILLVSKISVPTASIYKEWDKLRNFKLTKPKYGVNILNLALRRHDLPLIRECLFNGLEEVTTKLYPQALRAKEKLFSLGVQSILMSGSGPAMFCVVSSRKEALSLSRQLGKEEKSLRVFVTGTF